MGPKTVKMIWAGRVKEKKAKYIKNSIQRHKIQEENAVYGSVIGEAKQIFFGPFGACLFHPLVENLYTTVRH